MLRFVSFDEIEDRHLKALAASLIACPEFHRPDSEDMVKDIQAGRSKLFEFEGGLMLLSVEEHIETKERRLMIEAWAGERAAFKLHDLANDLRRIAADWQCDVIETLAFDLRLADAICRIGGRVESVCVTLPGRLVERVN